MRGLAILEWDTLSLFLLIGRQVYIPILYIPGVGMDISRCIHIWTVYSIATWFVQSTRRGLFDNKSILQNSGLCG